MPRPRKEERNIDIIKKKNAGWTFRAIADYFNIDVRAVWEIYHKYKDEYAKQ